MRTDDRAFESPSAVGQYWLARSEGFVAESTSGRRLGEVEEVAVDPATGEGAVVLASRGVFGTRRETVSTDRVRFVMPWSETIVVAGARPPVPAVSFGRPRLPGFGRLVPASRRGIRRARRSLGQMLPQARRALPYLEAARRAVVTEARAVARSAVELASATVPVARAVAAAVAHAVAALVAWLLVVTPVVAGRLRSALVHAWRHLDTSVETRRDPPQRHRSLPRASLRRE
jgi:hypothetical protein